MTHMNRRSCTALMLTFGMMVFAFALPVQAAKRTDATVLLGVSVECDSSGFVYTYLMTMAAGTHVPVDELGLRRFAPLSVSHEPEGWFHMLGPFQSRDTALVWAAVGLDSDPRMAPGEHIHQVPASTSLRPGTSLRGFSVRSWNAPGAIDYSIGLFEPIPVVSEDEMPGPFEPTGPTLWDSAVSGKILGPASTPDPHLPSCVRDPRPGTQDSLQRVTLAWNWSLRLSRAARAHAMIVDSNGQLVVTLLNGLESLGTISLTWDGRDDTGTPVPEGQYTLLTRLGREGLPPTPVIWRR